ncbi:MAG TPA: cupin domain-containing protein [Gemmatimonadales bacterium]
MLKAALLASCLLAFAATAAHADEKTVVTPNKIKWATAPQFGPGARVAVLSGDPAKSGPYVMRLKLPANATVPPHTHGGTENVTVLSGNLNLAFGDKLDKSKGQKLGPGAFFSIPADTPHSAWASSATIVQIHGTGPTDIKMVQGAK